jgi:hypothetical protein
MAINAALYTFNSSVSTTELSLTGGTSTIQTRTGAGLYLVRFDTNAIAVGDVFEVYVYDSVLTAGTVRKASLGHLSVGDAWAWMDPVPLAYAWDFSIKKLTGTDRTIVAAVFAVT